MNKPNQPETIDLRIAEVVSTWIETTIENRLTASELIDLHPELAPGLTECLRGLERVEQGKTARSRNAQQETDFEVEAAEFPVIPDFEILGELGRGGMGVVYDAKQISLDRFVALKVLPFGIVDPRSVKRFLREAETVASLSHPSIVPVHAVGVHGGLNWYAMQRIDGCPLSQWFAVSTFPSRAEALGEVVRIGIEAAQALNHAHQCGVVHRDVKPGNLLVDTSGKVWLADFGLARRDVDVTATATGAMLGTPRYMSAEQIANHDEDVDGRTDIYSLGATLYEMATGRPPFTSELPLELLTQIQRDEPTPPRKVDSSIPSALELVILKCLDKEPKRRYATAAALAEDLIAIRDHHPIAARGLPKWISVARFLKRNKRQVNAIATSVLATVALFISFGLLWQQHQQSKLGSVRINTPAGLYVANIQPRDATRSESHPGEIREHTGHRMLVTTPMQQVAELPAGEYVVRLEGEGNHSETVETTVTAGQTTELEYVDRRESLPSVDIDKKLAVPHRDGVLAVLGKEAFEVFDSPQSDREMRRFTIPIADLDSGLAEAALAARPSGASDQGDPPLTFAFDSEQTFQGDYNVRRSSFSRIERIAGTSFDLNSDRQPDYLVTAARHAAIAAVSADGSVLWKRHLPMSFEIAGALSRYPKNGMVNEVIVGITPVNDLDDDGTDDLVLNAALFDPSGFSRPYIFTLSGKSGNAISVAPLPTINMSKTNFWPWSGFLPYRREWNSNDRKRRNTTAFHFDGIMKRAAVHDLDNERWSHNNASSALYVLPPLVLTTIEERKIAATAIGQSIHFVETTDGKPIGTPIMLKNPICRGPLPVKIGDGEFGVVVLTGIPSNGFTKCFLELCVLGETAPRWSIAQDVSAYDLVAGAADTSFPWVVDLENDGSDEILTCIDPDYPSQWPQLRCYSAATGELKWTSPGISGIARLAEHSRIVGDIDRDGYLDFVLVGLSAPIPGTQAKQLAGASLVLDFFSGRTGQRMGYRDEWITSNVEKIPVMEIDSVELIGSELFCSVVYGQVDELKLSSLTITMDLSQWTPSIVSRGLTSLAPIEKLTKKSSGRWYRRRSGPYTSASDAAVWIEKAPIQRRFNGESLIASWATSDHQPRVLLSGKNSLARCVDPHTGSVVWEREGFYSNNASFTMPADGGATELIRQGGEAIIFIDAETGRSRFNIDIPDTGNIQRIELDSTAPERFIYALADGEPLAIRRRSLQRPSDRGFELLKIDRLEQRLVWSLQCLAELDASDRCWEPMWFQVDVNDDGVTDFLFGDTDPGKVVLRAIDGRDGETVWSKRLEISSDDWPRRKAWPLMSLVSSGTQDYVLVIDAVNLDEKSVDIKALRLRDGIQMSDVRMPIQNPPVARTDISIQSLAPDKRDGLFSIRCGHNYNGMFSNVFQLDKSGQEIKVIDRFESTWKTLDADVDHDQVMDRIDVFEDRSVEVHRGDTNDLLGSFELPGDIHFRRVESIGDKSYLVGWEQGKEHWWFELPSGRIALRGGMGLQTTTHSGVEYPRLLPYDGGTLQIGITPEGPMCRGVDIGRPSNVIEQSSNAAVVMLASQSDPRYARPLRFVGLYRYRTFLDIVWLAVRAAFAVLLPMGLVLQLIAQRQFSLRRALFLPAVALLAMICWRSILAEVRSDSVTNFTIGILTSASVWGVCIMLRDQAWKTLSAIIIVSCLLAGLFMLAEQHSLASTTLEVSGYFTLRNGSIAVLAVAAQVVIPIVLIGRWLPKLLAFAEQAPRRTKAKPVNANRP